MKRFDTSKLLLEPICKRKNDLDLSVLLPLTVRETSNPSLAAVARSIVEARRKMSSVVAMMGAHVLRDGVQNYLIDLMKKGFVSCIAVNGAFCIHDFEFALIGETTESVATYIKDGRFGMWQETGRINDIVNSTVGTDLGMGEAIGKAILEGGFPNKDVSILANAYRYKIPATVHVSIGCDIIHQHPNFDGAATGAASYKDFLTFAKVMENIPNGVIMNYGSAVMAPEIFLKALSMARNVSRQKGFSIGGFTVLVCDLKDLPGKIAVAAEKGTENYYFRPWKTMLVRTLMDGGKGYYVKGFHKETIPSLWSELVKYEETAGR
jgi:hypothetical protein